jgi:hypothetical protein
MVGDRCDASDERDGRTRWDALRCAALRCAAMRCAALGCIGRRPRCAVGKAISPSPRRDERVRLRVRVTVDAMPPPGRVEINAPGAPGNHRTPTCSCPVTARGNYTCGASGVARDVSDGAIGSPARGARRREREGRREHGDASEGVDASADASERVDARTGTRARGSMRVRTRARSERNAPGNHRTPTNVAVR